MGSVTPEPESLQAFLDEPDDGSPVVMINLLRFRERADYPAGSEAAACSGREAYQRYGEAVLPLIVAAGARPIWMGDVSSTLIAPHGEAWDEAILVEYPSRKAFLDMVSSPEYQAIVIHRTAALEDSRLIATRARLDPTGP